MRLYLSSKCVFSRRIGIEKSSKDVHGYSNAAQFCSPCRAWGGRTRSHVHLKFFYVCHRWLAQMECHGPQKQSIGWVSSKLKGSRPLGRTSKFPLMFGWIFLPPIWPWLQLVPHLCWRWIYFCGGSHPSRYFPLQWPKATAASKNF